MIGTANTVEFDHIDRLLKLEAGRRPATVFEGPAPVEWSADGAHWITKASERRTACEE